MSELERVVAAEYKRQQEELAKHDGLAWKFFGAALLALFFWVSDFLTGRSWSHLDWVFAVGAVWILPHVWRWTDKRAAGEEMRDRRAMRIEAKLDTLLIRQVQGERAEDLLEKLFNSPS